MKKLLKLEFTKLRKQKSFYICTLLAVVFILLESTLAFVMTNDEPWLREDMSGIQTMLTGIGSSFYVLLSSVFVVLFFCEDHTQQTIKNILAKGYTKEQVFAAKVISASAATTIMFVITELAALGIGTCFFGLGAVENLDFLAVIGTQYITNLANGLMCIVLCAMFRKTAASIVAMLFIPDLVEMALSLVDTILQNTKILISDFWFTSILNDACMERAVSGRMYECLWGSLAYIAIFLLVGTYCYRKQEL